MLERESWGLSAERARYILSLDFATEQHARYQDLAARVQEGALPASEEAELDELVAAGTILAILQSKARIALRNTDRSD
jgi:hypothetical protein